MKKKIVCDEEGRIKLVNVLKSGKISEVGQEDVTDDAISACVKHIVSMEEFTKSGAAGYSIPKNDGNGSGWFCFFDSELFELNLKPKKIAEIKTLLPKKSTGMRRGRRKKTEE